MKMVKIPASLLEWIRAYLHSDAEDSEYNPRDDEDRESARTLLRQKEFDEWAYWLRGDYAKFGPHTVDEIYANGYKLEEGE